WNGLMIAALAMGARVLGDESYLQAARRAADFVKENLRRPDGRLLARYREGESEYLAYAADYAYFIWGLIELYEAGFDSHYLALALELSEDLNKYFGDQKEGGFFFYGLDAEQLLARPKEGYDGAMPSYNAVAALNFMRLARLSSDLSWQEKAQQAMDYFAAEVQEYPTAHSFWLLAAIFQIYPGSEVVVAAESENQA
ncbi:MAG TPA: thioredoxin domain-containing protein, partial [Syntrophomonas wolfei]|nr:thioredoxin domain-containing protein [Syntrophomonas wolfei]